MSRFFIELLACLYIKYIYFVRHFTEGNTVISSCGGIRNVSLVQNISQLKSDTLQKFQIKIRRVVKFSQKNTTRCKVFPKKIRHVVKILL